MPAATVDPALKPSRNRVDQPPADLAERSDWPFPRDRGGWLRIRRSAEDRLGEQVRGRLIISCLLSITHHVVPEAELKYRKAYPGVEIHLREGLANEVYEDVRSGLADFGIGNVTGLGQEVVADEEVQESCFAVLPSRHLLCSKGPLSLRELRNEAFVSLPTAAGLRRQIDGVAAANGVALKHTTVVEQLKTSGSLHGILHLT